MNASLATARSTVEKPGDRGAFCGFSVMFLSVLLGGLGVADGRAEGLSPWSAPQEGRERAAIQLKRQWLKDLSSPGPAIELSSHLLLLGRREEALRALLAAHGATSSVQDRVRLETRVRVLARTFMSVDGARNYQAGLNALLAGDLKSAIARFDAVITTEQQVLDAVVRKGQAEVMLDNMDSAAESFRLAKQLDPFEPDVRLWLGFALLARGEKDEGEQEIHAAWRMASPAQRRRSHWKAWNARGQILQGRSGAAKKLMGAELPAALEIPAEGQGWALWVSLQADRSDQVLASKFLNLFPSGYRRLVGNEGLDLEWWDPRLLKREQERWDSLSKNRF
jgi:tetratricopeptide (TPR) repeat protein